MKTITGFEELGKLFGVSKRAQRKEPVIKCRKCGSVMKHIANTNVYICEGFKKDEDGNITKELCGSRYIQKARRI